MPQQFGEFILEKRLGSGGMAEVFVARRSNDVIGQNFVVKRCRGDVPLNSELLRRLQLEAQVASAHDHPNLVDLIEFGRVGDVPYLAMEYVRGIALDRILEHTFGTGRPPPTDVAMAIGLGILEGLSALHGATQLDGSHRPILHRDVKPNNVIVSQRGRSVLIDYGIAFDVLGRRISRESRVMGTPRYMAPECGVTTTPDARADVFSVSMILFELLTARHAWPPELLTDPAELIRLSEVEVDEEVAASMPDGVLAALLPGLKPDAESRYANATEMLHALNAAQVPGTLMSTAEREQRVTAWLRSEGLPSDEMFSFGVDGRPVVEEAQILTIPPLGGKPGFWSGRRDAVGLALIAMLGVVCGGALALT